MAGTWNYESGKLYRESEYVNDELEGIQKSTMKMEAHG